MTLKTAPLKQTRNISDIMRKVSSTNTTPELFLRKALWGSGLRNYRVQPEELPGKPDIIFPTAKLAIFIDGDYWHGGQWRARNLKALEEQFQNNRNKAYWLNKIRRNMERDCKNTHELISKGWTVIRFWERDIMKDLNKCVSKVYKILENGASYDPLSLVPQKTFAEFFAGIGLVRMGLENEGWKLAFANDIDPKKREMYEEHYGKDESFLEGDIHCIPVEKIPQITLATASFPCNDLSLAGAQKGLSGKQSSAFWGFVRILKEMGDRKPPFVLLENVTGFLYSHGGKDFNKALIALNELGYIVDTFILDAVNYVPQSRKRLFVIGILENISDTMDKDLSIIESEIRPKPLIDFIADHKEIKWQIRPLPECPSREINLEDILDDIPDESKEWWSHERAKYLLAQMSPKHQEIAKQMISGENYTYGTVFRRMRNGSSMAELRTDGIAGCLRTPRGGSGKQILFKAGKGKYFVRLLSPRECARLMGANDYKITVALNQALFGFGDAVCVPVIEWIAKYYLNPLVNEVIHERPISICI